ncbi:MAG: YgiT-type zinc finger protein [Blastocatellia bacterium]
MKKTVKPKKIRRNPAFTECAYCGTKKARPVLLNHVFGAGANMIVVENVLTMVCDNCGQSYFTGDTLEKLDEVLAAPQDYAVQTAINVADLSLV